MGHVTVAVRTLAAIDQQLRADQGASFRGWEGKVLPHIEDAYRTDEDGHRTHLGASLLGGECGRAIWYNFRWATKGNFDGKTLRLFNRGHIEEGRFIALLLMIGCEVWQQDENGKQFRISWAEGHAGGSGDGISRGIPDLPPNTPFVAEFKTHSEKSFIELAGDLKKWREYVKDPSRNSFPGKGVREAKFEHYVQMNLYMRKMGIPVALYMAVNKNTDDLYAELVTLNVELADQMTARGETLVWMDAPPTKLNNSPGFFKCRFCDHRPVCHLKAAPDQNCRTCIYSEPVVGAEWKCLLHDRTIPKEMQLTGCEQYKVAPYYG